MSPTATTRLSALERFDARRALDAHGVLRAFNDAGVLDAADVHVARRLARIVGIPDDLVVLGAALAARAPRLGHVCIDIADPIASVTAESDLDVDVATLAWPEPEAWRAALAASAAVADGPDGEDDRPLRLVGDRLYLDRYWRRETEVIADLVRRSATAPPTVDAARLRSSLDRLFARNHPVAGTPDLQRLACAVAVLRRFTVVAGGPGTGKTTTVARILASLDEQRAGDGPTMRVALAAPTGKAAARLQEAVHHEARQLDVDEPTRARLLALQGSTLHRLLGWQPGNRSRFKHHRGNRLPHEVVVVDEASMVSLSLMAKLMEAVRPDARLVLVGDPDQLASVEAGAVLGDVVGPAARGLRMTPPWRTALRDVVGEPIDAADPPAHDAAPPGAGSVGDGIVVLRTVHRYGGHIAELAAAVQCGDLEAALSALRAGADDVTWIDRDLATPGAIAALEPVRRRIVEAGAGVVDAARLGDARAAIDALGAVRVLCAHRHGPYGVTMWMPVVERWLAEAIEGYGADGRWYVGRPLLVTENDHGLQLYNGDTGVVVAAGDGRVQVAFERRGGIVRLSPTRLSTVESVHAMTVHKSQGSQFGSVAVLLPDPGSPILSRELLYTAVTRAQRHLVLAGTEDAVRAAVERPVARASGLRAGLWGDG